MLNYKTSIKGDITYSDLEIKEIKPIMKLIVRGKTKEFMTAIGKNLNMLLPTEANTSTSTEKLTAFWLSPDEWMLTSNETVSEDSNTYEVEDELIKSISKQASKLIHISNYYYIEEQSLLAEKLVKLSKLSSVFFCNSGCEANEAAIKLANLIDCS